MSFSDRLPLAAAETTQGESERVAVSEQVVKGRGNPNGWTQKQGFIRCTVQGNESHPTRPSQAWLRRNEPPPPVSRKPG
jgi:hypothetical protein